MRWSGRSWRGSRGIAELPNCRIRLAFWRQISRAFVGTLWPARQRVPGLKPVFLSHLLIGLKTDAPTLGLKAGGCNRAHQPKRWCGYVVAIMSFYGDDYRSPRQCPRQIRAGDRAGGARPAAYREQDLLRLLDALWRSAKYERLPGVPGTAGGVAGAEQKGGGVRGAGGHGAELPGE